jgi:hypothetical protein
MPLPFITSFATLSPYFISLIAIIHAFAMPMPPLFLSSPPFFMALFTRYDYMICWLVSRR